MLKINVSAKDFEQLKEENIKLEKENESLKEEYSKILDVNMMLKSQVLNYKCVINNLKNTLLCEDGSVDVDELKEMGFNVVIYRQGSNKPILLDTQYRKVGGDNAQN